MSSLKLEQITKGGLSFVFTITQLLCIAAAKQVIESIQVILGLSIGENSAEA